MEYNLPVPKTLTAQIVFTKLSKLYRPPKTFLTHRSHLDLLVATILSAQCTDKKVNEVTRTLFKKYRKAKDYVKVTQAEFEKDIKQTGFFRTKAKNIRALCHILLQEHGGRVPKTMEELVKLPGVGRKTAAIIIYALFGKNEGVAVDTHVMRLSQRMGLTKNKDPKKIEKDLMAALPRSKWGKINPLMISHGRAVCTARNRKCGECVFRRECPASLIY